MSQQAISLKQRRRASVWRVIICLPLVVLPALPGCRRERLPAKSSPEYSEVVRAFFVGLAALQVGHDVEAETRLAQVTRLAAAEPAGWGNWGLLALRQRNYDQAADRLNRARSLAPDNDQILYLIGLLESSRGRTPEAIAALRQAIDINPKNLIATFKLAEEVERQGDETSEAEFQRLMQQILSVQPENLAALLELSRVAAKRGDTETMKSTVARIAARSNSWPPEVQQQLAALQAAAGGSDPRSAATRTSFLRNVLMRVPEFRQSLSQLKPPPGEEAVPFDHFLRMESPVFAPAAPDKSIHFDPRTVTDFSQSQWDWTGAIFLSGTGLPVIAVANSRAVQLANGASFPFPGGAANSPPSLSGVLALDFSYDFKTDLVLAGAGGVRLMRQNDPKSFTDVTGDSKLPESVVKASYNGAWACDIEADGDLDIVLGADQGEPTVLRNNGDGSFLPIHPFKGVSGLKAFAWADLDADGNPDAALIDGAGKLHVFSNQRQGQFVERSLPNLSAIRAISVADVNSDGLLDLVAVQDDGAIIRLSDKDEGHSWDLARIGTTEGSNLALDKPIQLRLADLDNNGGLDLLILSPSSQKNSGVILLSDENHNFISLDQPPSLGRIFDAADLDGDGRIDLLGLDDKGQPYQAINHGSKNYHWQVVRPHAVQAADQRINPFGVGGEMEIRAGLLLQKQLITGPLLHFGLGDQPSADVIRIVWPNGSVRAEFAVKADQEVVTEQRLKGSCPFLFAYNGKRMEFVKDTVPWGSAIGLRINTLGSANIAATSEWYKIGRDQLVPHDGFYDLRITAELWEVYYYDYLALMTVDHPAGTEVFADERFVIPPVKLGYTTVETPHPLARAIDDKGTDVSEILRDLDGKTVDNFDRGQYQGVAQDHYLELDLGDSAPSTGPLYLIANGSIRPTDSSINVALTQGTRWQARPMSLEVPDGKGGWIVVRSNLGFPAGRKKTVLFDLTNVFRPGRPHRVRIRTNLEIYWDQIQWARGLPDTQVKTATLNSTSADLHYRGFSVIHRPDAGAPEIPEYNKLAATTQIWRDLIGYYTRYGEVGELLKQIDDRYVIVAAGDEMSLRFPEQPPPPAGWLRDFIIVGDGWIKDGDYNSTFSKTVQPLPYHSKQEYTEAPGRLEDEWVYRQHPEDWQTYHTRYITPEVFRTALTRQTKR